MLRFGKRHAAQVFELHTTIAKPTSFPRMTKERTGDSCLLPTLEQEGATRIRRTMGAPIGTRFSAGEIFTFGGRKEIYRAAVPPRKCD
ncbi:hypothetical protein [Amycolatopsis pigmentata]|uniref:Uncharacterized protein n=1 Tax=Amycolatopsis pigmentata TaxID=450801 RepID=A0ABW5FWU2_9PSEU